MIFTGLLLLATQTAEMDAVIGRYKTYMASHPAISADVTISGAAAGKGVITIRRPVHAMPKVNWDCKVAGSKYHFVCDGKICMDVAPDEAVYDRLPAVDGPYPPGRIAIVFGFPFPLVSGDTPFANIKSDTVLSHKGNLVELKATKRSAIGDLVLTAEFAPDGQLHRYSVEKGIPGKMTAEVCEFSNYRFGAAAVSSNFDVRPPLGYAPHAFDLALDPIQSGASLPDVHLTGHGGADLATLASAPKGLFAFVDDPMPEGLAQSLMRLNSSVPVTVIAMKGSGIKLSKLALYEADSAGFDAAHISVTPQFYFVSQGKVVQAWQGFRANAASAFEHELLTFVSRR